MRIWISLIVVVIGMGLLVPAFSSASTGLIILAALTIVLGIGIQFVRLPASVAQTPPAQAPQSPVSDSGSYVDASDTVTDAVETYVAAEVVGEVMDVVVDFFLDD